ncbi:hypothetical protein SORBI_3001G247800 [Sorghum bicolor]|uniref:Uncharacterized protein n=1 Tax=Sorghum bicolor TaxID=4558 RepID=A0A1B6QKT6_SORBI|nr:hypothetical protein SORBI_3001G247800 [Sorghum bicolor]
MIYISVHSTTTKRLDFVFICFTRCSLILISTLRLRLRTFTPPLARLTTTATPSTDATPALASCRPALLASAPSLSPFLLCCLHCSPMFSNEPILCFSPTRDEDGGDGYDEI